MNNWEDLLHFFIFVLIGSVAYMLAQIAIKVLL